MSNFEIPELYFLRKMSDKEKAPSEHLLGANLSSRGPKKKNQVHFTFFCLSRKNLQA